VQKKLQLDMKNCQAVAGLIFYNAKIFAQLFVKTVTTGIISSLNKLVQFLQNCQSVDKILAAAWQFQRCFPKKINKF